MNYLLAISPLDGRYIDKVRHLQEYVSEFGLIKYRVKVEIEWLKLLFATPEVGLIPLNEDELQHLDAIYNNFDLNASLRVKEIEKVTNHDVKAIEYYIKEQIASCNKLHQYREYVHFACTSEDINNLSYGLMLKDIKNQILKIELDKVLQQILTLATKYKLVPMMSRTHGQSATPTTVGKEFYNVYYRLLRQLELLDKQQLLGKINGAVGNYNSHVVSHPQVNWHHLAKILVEEQLGLTFNPYTTQIEPHDYIAEIMDNLCRINTILLDFCRDMWGYIAYNYFKQKVIAGEVGSSTMPHKVNPIDFENSEGNLGLANALATHLAQKLPISRFQRDLTDSTVQRNLGVVIGYSVLAYSSLLKGLNKLEINTEVINKDLDDNWELLAEPIQTVMRKFGISNAYEKLKDLTRGKKLNQSSIATFIQSLELPQEVKQQLLSLTPHNYIGLADRLF
ncbi:MAG: adenylosuccinate lyase [Burkholderiales bacterium]|nr:adenylosuccinate lyase [Burkholderiales bacterium]